jgi:hypothetical protein
MRNITLPRILLILLLGSLGGCNRAEHIPDLSEQEFAALGYKSATQVEPNSSVVRRCERDLRQHKQDAWKFVAVRQRADTAFYVFDATPRIFDAPSYVYVYLVSERRFLGRYALGGGA